MGLLDYNKFETAHKLLENSAPSDIDQQLLESNGLTVEDVDAVNEGFLKDLFGGWFKKFKTKMLRKVPGGVLKKADAIAAKYEAEKMELFNKEIKEKEKIYKAEVAMEKGEDATKNQKIIDNSKEAVKAIRKAGNAKIEKFNTEFAQLSDGKSDMVADYINLKVAEVQEKIAVAELEAVQKFASEDRVEELTKEVEDRKKKREDVQKELEKAVSQTKELAGASAKKDEMWVRKNNKGEEVVVIILDEPGKGGAKEGEVHVKSNTKKGTEYAAKVSSLIKKVDEDKKDDKKDDKKESKIKKIDKEAEAA